MREFLEKNYTDEAIETDDLTIKLVIKALLEVSLYLKPGQDEDTLAMVVMVLDLGNGQHGTEQPNV